MDAEELEAIRGKLQPQLKKECGQHEMQMVFFMLTNIIDESTRVLYYGKGAKELIQEAFPDEEDEVLRGVISRKKQLIPAFMTALQQRG